MEKEVFFRDRLTEVLQHLVSEKISDQEIRNFVLSSSVLSIFALVIENIKESKEKPHFSDTSLNFEFFKKSTTESKDQKDTIEIYEASILNDYDFCVFYGGSRRLDNHCFDQDTEVFIYKNQNIELSS